MAVIFGGTGTLGKALVKQLYGKIPIHIDSRCEIRQSEMMIDWPDCLYHLGDVTNPYSLPFIRNPGPVFNRAAMKHVERGQDNHEYCVNVNYNGVINTYSWAHTHGASSYTQSSTDKAIEPINTYGKAKSLAEDYLLSRHRVFPISIFNWGNILGSRGSVLQKFINSIKEEKTIYITDIDMTRFFLTIDTVARFMVRHHETCGYHIPDMKSAKVIDLGLATAEFLGYKREEIEIKVIGNRGGEKIHEKLGNLTSDKAEKFTDKELIELIGKVHGK